MRRLGRAISRVVAAVVLCALVGGIAVGGGAFWLRRAADRPGPLEAAKDFVVASGGAGQVADALKDGGVIDMPFEFKVLAWLSRANGPLHASELSFPAHASLRQVLAVLRTGKPVDHRITFAEGLTSRQIAAVINKADAAVGMVEPPEEGSVLPETYSYEYGTQRAAILSRAQASMTRELAAAWAGRSADVALKDPREVLVLASIVERETGRPDERPHIAAVYLNRLRIGMKLQADPTVVYAASNGLGVLDHKLTRSELDRDDPYNTYRVAGLPPGPICSPGPASLKAVTNPAVSDDLYFVADGNGGHSFSRTREAHERNVARWRAVLELRSGTN